MLGTGVTVSNIVYNGSPTAIGKFVGTNTNLGIDSGIVITTGMISGLDGPEGPNGQSNAGVELNTPGTTLFSTIISGVTYDAATLEFDFIPSSDTVRFKYVFGSEEYPEFAPPNNADYNDIFGFFISGPGIVGQQNIAKLSNGALVSINNINAITNPSFFIDNGDGLSAPQNASSSYIQYDGFTKVLEAISKVQCGQTYHLVIAIADVGDGAYDSGIFLQASSLKSTPLVTASYTLSNQLFPSNPAMMAEGCTSATVKFTRNNSGINSPLTLPLSVSGTATQGVDYSTIPSSITFLPGQTTVEFTINAFADLLTEGQETLTLQFNMSSGCNNVQTISVNLFIGDRLPVSVSIQGDTLVCTQTSTVLTAVVTGGVAPLTYAWSTGESTATITAAPTSSQLFYVTVTDNCATQNATDTVTVIVANPTPLSVTTSSDTIVNCPFTPATLQAFVTGGTAPYAFTWSSAQNANLGSASSLQIAPSATTNYFVSIKDICNNKLKDSILYTVLSPPITLAMSPGVEVCPGENVLLSVTATGGTGVLHYVWTPTGAITPSTWVKPLTTTTYTVSVSDDCAAVYSAKDSVTITIVKPTADFVVLNAFTVDGIPIAFQNTSTNAVSYYWSFGDGNSSATTHSSNTYQNPGTYDVMLIARDAKGCVDTIVKPILISDKAFFVYVPNAFTPDGSRVNNTFSASLIGVKSISIDIFNRWGEIIYSSSELNFKWDGRFKGEEVPQGTYTWKMTYITNSLESYDIEGHVTILR